MKQVLQDLSNGNTLIEDVPSPMLKPGHVKIRTHKTLVSVGTEKMLVDFGRANLIQKARQQPDKVRMVLDKVKTDGLVPTYEAVKNKLSQPLPMGYCNVGTVIELGAGVTEFKIGDRVVSNGHHAEVVVVPKNLCAQVPDQVSDEAAAFTVIGAIALQGMRIVNPTFGETIAVFGMGIIGILTVQLLRANGCQVLAIDFDQDRLTLAQQYGAKTINLAQGQDPVAIAMAHSKGVGIDGVIIAASTTSNDPVHQAANMCRKRGRIVLVGVVGLNLSRADFYEKELSFQVSCSYGPGRYDSLYEQQGQDYPIGFVRWTEQRNFEAVLQGLNTGSIHVDHLITHRFKIDDADKAYDAVTQGSSLGILLECDANKLEETVLSSRVVLNAPSTKAIEKVSLGLIGAGNYASKVLLPAFADTGVTFHSAISSSGVSGVSAAKKFNFMQCTTDVEEIFHSKDINTVVVASRHDSHANYVVRALQAGMHVFCEKPLAINNAQLAEVKQAYQLAENNGTLPVLMLGFNRRFSPLSEQVAANLHSRSEPIAINILVNAGAIPADSWIQDLESGGGRIIGEGCHFVDLCRYFVGERISGVHAMALRNSKDNICTDKLMMSLEFEDGSIASIQYLANGSAAFPKERVEVFSGGSVFQIDNFRSLRSWGGGPNKRLWRQDKGQGRCVDQFVEAIKEGRSSPIAFSEMIEVTEATFELHKQAQKV